MTATNLAAMDLNLLVVLDALLIEKSVSRAARRVHATQPGVSRALGRLRAWFGDPLLTRTRHGMVPTPVGAALSGEVRAVLEQIQGIVERRDAFDPATSRRVFRLTMTDYPQHVLCGRLLARLSERAPLAAVSVLPWSLAFPEALESGSLDLAVSPPPSATPGLVHEELFTDENVVIVRRGHPAVADRLTLPVFASLAHLQAAPNGREGSLLDDLLEAAGHRRRVVMRVPSAVTLPGLVSSSDCCATIPARLAAAMQEQWSLRTFPVPLPFPGISLRMVWHERTARDPGVEWLRAELRAIAAEEPGPRHEKVATMNLTRRAPRTL